MLTEIQLDDIMESRIELIDFNPALFEALEEALLDCMANAETTASRTRLRQGLG